MPNVRTITFAATSIGVTPTGPQEAGVQGDPTPRSWYGNRTKR